jgi:hypothetical protein
MVKNMKNEIINEIENKISNENEISKEEIKDTIVEEEIENTIVKKEIEKDTIVKKEIGEEIKEHRCSSLKDVVNELESIMADFLTMLIYDPIDEVKEGYKSICESMDCISIFENKKVMKMLFNVLFEKDHRKKLYKCLDFFEYAHINNIYNLGDDAEDDFKVYRSFLEDKIKNIKDNMYKIDYAFDLKVCDSIKIMRKECNLRNFANLELSKIEFITRIKEGQFDEIFKDPTDVRLLLYVSIEEDYNISLYKYLLLFNYLKSKYPNINKTMNFKNSIYPDHDEIMCYRDERQIIDEEFEILIGKINKEEEDI